MKKMAEKTPRPRKKSPPQKTSHVKKGLKRQTLDKIIEANKAIININRSLKQYPNDPGLLHLKSFYEEKKRHYSDDLAAIERRRI
jgi:hypothetical protein